MLRTARLLRGGIGMSDKRKLKLLRSKYESLLMFWIAIEVF